MTDQSHRPGNPNQRFHRQPSHSDGCFPYSFSARESCFDRNEPPFHDKLEKDRFDVAFEITWQAISAIAANPCTTTGPATCSDNRDGFYAGYNKRWLTIDNKLAISPFTVKSAIASGFANLMGGCYRVNTIVEPHKKTEQGQYPFTGAYKRYRVNMGGQSKPGILLSMENVANGKTVTIQPCKEFYYDQRRLDGIVPGQTVYTNRSKMEDRRNKPPIIKEFSLARNSENDIGITYYCPYLNGMDQKERSHHQHRFYQEAGNPVTGIIPKTNFESVDKQKKLVFMGQYNHQVDKPWYEDLNSLVVGSWVYYEIFGGVVTNIGKNFLFKALFLHEDTIPKDQEACSDMNLLCPRCQMFGMTDETGRKDREAVGYRGRFKSATLVSEQTLDHPERFSHRIPEETQKSGYRQVELTKWKSGGQTVCRQILMRIAGPPKPNKRDVNGYFSPQKGCLKGVKTYQHGTKGAAGLDDWRKTIEKLDGEINRDQGKFVTSHKLRNYAVVCEKDMTFHGTVGVDNASPEEIAAMLMLLEHSVAGHGFKIGLGKAWGLGSMISHIRKVWFRSPSDNRWISFPFEQMDWKHLVSEMENQMPGVGPAVQDFKKVANLNQKINPYCNHGEKMLEYPRELRFYWKNAKNSGLHP